MDATTAKSELGSVDIERILQLLPHRYPFLLVDRIIEMNGDDSCIGIKNVTFNEPQFQGHFPGRPVMPGVLIIEGMTQTAGALCIQNLQADKPQMMSLFGVTEQGFSKIKIGSRPEIWASGLRNPYMFHFDDKSGDLFIADVGQNHWEEINWQPKSSKGGENYGWKFNMATKCHPLTGPDDKCPIVGVLPVAEYPHQEPYPGAPKLTDGWGCSAQGLGVANYGGMEKTYVIGDWCSGRVWA